MNQKHRLTLARLLTFARAHDPRDPLIGSGVTAGDMTEALSEALEPCGGVLYELGRSLDALIEQESPPDSPMRELLGRHVDVVMRDPKDLDRLLIDLSPRRREERAPTKPKAKLPSQRFRELNAELRAAVKAPPIAAPGLEIQSLLDLLDERLGRSP